jgi:hypothetical protein
MSDATGFALFVLLMIAGSLGALFALAWLFPSVF